MGRGDKVREGLSGIKDGSYAVRRPKNMQRLDKKTWL